ncbi:MAG TPA: GNAT family N-acetyltransferase, partial [Anaerolineaceae bacterium]|nr:GNAT family N-acetyltransferase [Anaerolineaceae bacterium]
LAAYTEMDRKGKTMAPHSIIDNPVQLAEAPAIAGLSFRRFRGEEDYPKMIAVINAAKVADGVERTETVEDMRRNYTHLTNCDPWRDLLFAEVNGELVAYSRVFWLDVSDGSGTRLYTSFGFVKPEWRRKGLGRAMLRENERRLREIAAGHPVSGPRLYESFGKDTEVENHRMLLSEGYQEVRHGYIMVRPDLENIPEPVLPAGLEVRPVRPDQVRQVWEASQDAFKDHWSYIRESEEEYQRWLEDPSFDPSLWRVAWDGDQVAGMVLSFIEAQQNEEYGQKRGWTENICVLRPYRKQGLARALILLSLQAIKERGMTEAALGVDTQNTSGALRLYESVGFRPIECHTTYRKSLPVPELDTGGR